MFGVPSQIYLLAVMLVTLASSHIVLAQRELEKRTVPSEVRTRLDLYFELLHREDWEKLYEIEAWPRSDKSEYIAIHTKFKGNTYSSVSKLLEVGLSDSMTYYSQAKAWRIDGCGKFRDKNVYEITAVGSVSVSNDPKRGWIVLSFIPTLYSDGWHQCGTPIDEFPIKILNK
ncbi:hypothetical protein BH10ACI2_BH10ACI2_00640 [soil metagenome]